MIVGQDDIFNRPDIWRKKVQTNQEINESVARKLGVSDRWPWQWDGKQWITYEGGGVWDKYGKPPLNIPNYCGSIEAAWEVVEKVGFDRFRIIKARFIPEWSAIFEFQTLPDKKITEFYACDESLPMAICLAFLKMNNE